MFACCSRLPWWPCILAGALALRIVAAVAVQHWVEKTPGRLCLIEGDAAGYWKLALHIEHGEDYAVYDPPRFVERMPGFPLVLAGAIKLCGSDLLRIRLLLAVLGTLACGLVYWLGRELVDPTAGLIACFLAAVSPIFIVFSVLLLSETVFAVTLLASLVALTKLAQAPSMALTGRARHRSIGMALSAGLLAGLATLVRPTWLLVAPAFSLVYVFTAPQPRQRFLLAVVLIAGLALALAPWTIRNYRVTGHFIPTTLWVGPSLYDGLSPQATGESDMWFVETEGWYAQRGNPEFEYEADRHYRRAAIEFVHAHPRRVIELALEKLKRFINPFPNAGQFNHWVISVGVGLFEMPLLILAAVGLWQSRRERWTWLLAAGPVVYFGLVHMIFIGSVRYRLPAEYALLVLTAVGCRWLWGKRLPRVQTLT